MSNGEIPRFRSPQKSKWGLDIPQTGIFDDICRLFKEWFQKSAPSKPNLPAGRRIEPPREDMMISKSDC